MSKQITSTLYTLGFASCLLAMAVPHETEQEVKTLLSPSCALGINLRLQKVLSLLEEKGLVYNTVVRPSAMVCHPQNRGGSMINPYNCHRKGQDIIASGVKPELLAPNSLAVEMALEPAAKSSQIAANQKMILDAKGLLAPLKGDERFCTLANSHFVQWSRALEHGCVGPDGIQLTPPLDMKPLLLNGWSWKVISNDAERMFPDLPAFAAMAMNSHNSTQIASNELECMMQLGELYSGGMKLDDAVKAVQHSAPACKTYLDDVGHFCKMYTGGASFPLLKCLDTFCTLPFLLVDFGLKFGLHQKLCHARGSLGIMHLSQISLGKKHGHSLLIGEEMMNHLAFYDFKIQGRSMALTRVALAAAMLSSKKHQDGISRLIYNSDFDKLKGKDTTRKVDEALSSLWDQVNQPNLDWGYMCWCTAAVRMVLHILQKEKIAKQDSFESFEKIVQHFADDLQAAPVSLQTQPAPSEPFGSSTGPVVKDMVKASNKEVALFRNSHIKLGEKQLVCNLHVFFKNGDQTMHCFDKGQLCCYFLCSHPAGI